MSARDFTRRRIRSRRSLVAVTGDAAVGMSIAAPAALAAHTQTLPGGELPSQCSSLPSGGFVATSSTGGIPSSAGSLS